MVLFFFFFFFYDVRRVFPKCVSQLIVNKPKKLEDDDTFFLLTWFLEFFRLDNEDGVQERSLFLSVGSVKKRNNNNNNSICRWRGFERDPFSRFQTFNFVAGDRYKSNSQSTCNSKRRKQGNFCAFEKGSWNCLIIKAETHAKRYLYIHTYT